jgi:hypothetical protein
VARRATLTPPPRRRRRRRRRRRSQSIDTWYNATDLFLTDFRRFPNSTFNYILSSPGNQALFGSRTFRSILNSTALAQVDALLAGAPFDARNLSAARVHYTVSDYGEGQSWLYNFNLFYSWNGCSNQALAVSADGRAAVREYLLCPVGVHEADLERVSVIVCKADGSVQRVAYSQHGWTEVRDCGRGQCRFAEGTSNPLAFVGLDSHANYPDPSPLAVYEFLNASVAGKPSLDNLGGVWLGDRTAGGGGGGRRWAPRPDNVVYIPPPDVIVAQVRPRLCSGRCRCLRSPALGGGRSSRGGRSAAPGARLVRGGLQEAPWCALPAAESVGIPVGPVHGQLGRPAAGAAPPALLLRRQS